MKILAFDTATEMCSAALYLDGNLTVREVLAGNKHSELLLPMVTDLLREAGLKLRELDGLAYGKGPGSFTGLRIGCGVAQGLAFGADLPVVGVVTLEAMALEARHTTPGTDRVITCLDARMHEVYAAAWRWTGTGFETALVPVVCKPGDVPVPEGADWLGCGSGFDAYGPLLTDRLAGALGSVASGIHPHARSIAMLAIPRFAAGEAGPPESAEPLYVRDKVALKTCERV